MHEKHLASVARLPWSLLPILAMKSLPPLNAQGGGSDMFGECDTDGGRGAIGAGDGDGVSRAGEGAVMKETELG